MAGNGYAGKVGWTVGLSSWLDDPASKVNRYWRAIEWGKEETGLILIGLWGDRAGVNTRPNPLREGQALTAAGGGVDQKWVAFGETHSPATALRRARFALWYYVTKGAMNNPTPEQLEQVFHHSSGSPAGRKANRAVFSFLMTKTTSAEQIPFVRAVVAKPMIAHEYYEKAVQSFNPLAREVEAFREIIGQMIYGAVNGGPVTLTRARKLKAFDAGGTARTGRANLEQTDARAVMGSQQGIGYERGNISPRQFIEGGIATATASAQTQDLIRGGGGRFPPGVWQQAVIDINIRVASEFQAHLIALMDQGSHLRPATFDLIKAHGSPNNRFPR